ncbi:hypothetical protein K501DRAFT_280809, partial [Backusella circina FSU 941]
SKLSIADWYWKSGIFFFFLTIGNQSVSLADQFFGSDVQLQICQKRLSSIQVQASIITELCGLNIRINYVNTIVSLFRDVFVCGIYSATAYIYTNHFIDTMKQRQQEVNYMHDMQPNETYPGV